MPELIAERILDHYAPDATEPEHVIVRIHKAEVDADGVYRAIVEIHGPRPGESFQRGVSGSDSMQATIGAIWLVPVFLRTLKNRTGGRLQFEGSDDLGFYMEPHEAFQTP